MTIILEDISIRLKLIRKELKLSQNNFSKKINIGQTTLAQFELGTRKIKDIHIKRICDEFNINEEWLKNGIGEMFNKKENISLDDFAKQNNVSDLELEIIKAYMKIPSEDRNKIIQSFKEALSKEDEKKINQTVTNVTSTNNINNTDENIQNS